MRTTAPRLLVAGALVAGVMTAALGSDQPALATALGWDQPPAAAPAVGVPCRTAALAAALTSATDGETLQLAATCRYVLTTALPDITVNLTIAGRGATLERSDAGGQGGGIYQEYSGPIPNQFLPAMSLTGSQVLDNFAAAGGGIYNTGGGTVSPAHSAVARNRPDNCAPAGAVPGCTG